LLGGAWDFARGRLGLCSGAPKVCSGAPGSLLGGAWWFARGRLVVCSGASARAGAGDAQNMRIADSSSLLRYLPSRIALHPLIYITSRHHRAPNTLIYIVWCSRLAFSHEFIKKVDFRTPCWGKSYCTQSSRNIIKTIVFGAALILLKSASSAHTVNEKSFFRETQYFQKLHFVEPVHVPCTLHVSFLLQNNPEMYPKRPQAH
jgi:hypothetical protein